MCNKDIKKLPFWETVGRSFKYVLKNKKLLLALLPVVAVLTVIQIVLKTPVMCVYNEGFCSSNWQNTLSGLTLVITAVGIIINYCRSIVCKETVDFTSLKFLKRAGFYILWSFLLTFVIGIPVVIAIIILSITGADVNILLLTSMCLFFIVGTALAPLIIALPALAVDDYKLINLSKLFNLCKGNKMAIFFGQFVIMFPYMLLSKMFVYIYALIGANSFAVNICFAVITLLMLAIDASFRGAFFAHIYQFLKYYNKDK